MTLKTKLIGIVALAILVTATALEISFIVGIGKLEGDITQSSKQRVTDNAKESIKSNVKLAISTIKGILENSQDSNKIVREQTQSVLETMTIFYNLNRDKMSKEELKQELKNFIKHYRYKIFPKDKKGNRLFYDMVQVCKQKGSGFIQYMWNNPRTGKLESKISFVATFKPFNWIIGTGVYKSDVRNKMEHNIITTLSAMRYGKHKDGYFFAYKQDDKGNTYFAFHGTKTRLNGKKTDIHKPDAKGNIFREQLIKVAKNGGGFVRYYYKL